MDNPPFDSPRLLFRVVRSLHVPGLGLLALSAQPVPHLELLPLYTALAVRLHLPDGTMLPATATVEEVAEADSTPQRALLMQGNALPNHLPAGTEVWEALDATDAYAGLR